MDLEDLLEGKVWCGKSYDEVGGRGRGSTLSGPEEASGEMTANLGSYIYIKGGSQAKIWEKPFQAERTACGRLIARWNFSSAFCPGRLDHGQETVGDKGVVEGEVSQ